MAIGFRNLTWKYLQFVIDTIVAHELEICLDSPRSRLRQSHTGEKKLPSPATHILHIA